MDDFVINYIVKAYENLSETINRINLELKTLNKCLKIELEKEQKNNEN